MTQEIFKRYEKKYMLTQKKHDALIPVLERQMNADHYGNIPYPIFTLTHGITSWSGNPLRSRNIRKSCV